MGAFDGFVDAAVKSGLGSREQLADIVAAVKYEISPAAPDETRLNRLIQLAIERQLLTAWQCEKLLEGRYKGFFLGPYKLVDFLGSTRTGSRYAARNKQDVLVDVLVARTGGRMLFVAMKSDSFIEDDAMDS